MRLSLFSVALAALTGCAGATHTVDLRDDLSRVNASLAGRPAVVILQDGTAYAAAALRLAADSTSWIDPQTGALVVVPTEVVGVVERRDRKRASERLVRRGALVGAAVGAVLGGMAGNEFSECFIVCSEPTATERAKGIAVFGVSGALGGALFGAYGGIITSIVSSPTERFVVAPPGASPAAGGAGETGPNGTAPPNRAP